MSSGIDDFLDHVDQWKLKVHAKLKRMTPVQRQAFWRQIHEQARARGLGVDAMAEKALRATKRGRRTG